MDEGDAAERLPLGSERLGLDDIERAEGYEFDDGERYSNKGKGKGKERAQDREEVMFALGDDDEDDRH